MTTNTPLPEALLRKMDAYWRAANYLSVGQIYLYDNPLLKKPLTLKHIKPRLLGHWGTTPGLNFIYVHLNRVIREHDLNMIYITGPGHGGPGWWPTPTWRAPTARCIPNISQDEDGMRRLFKQFSFPGGIPSHVAPETPGSIHEGGELGYSLSHAYGAAFDNPDLIVACVVGDGEAETGPLATELALEQVPQPGPRRRGAADPAPERLQDRQPHRAGAHSARGTGDALPRLRLHALFRRGRRPRDRCTSSWPPRSTRWSARFSASSTTPATTGFNERPALAHDRAAHAQGLDRPEGRGRQADRGHVALAPGAAGRHETPGARRSCWRSG